jgi:hypothetical protein
MFRARIGHVRYGSHRYRIAALRQYMARPAKPIKVTTRQGSGDDNASIGHDGTTRSCHSGTQIIRHIAELLQYDRVRKLANIRIACTLERDRPP